VESQPNPYAPPATPPNAGPAERAEDQDGLRVPLGTVFPAMCAKCACTGDHVEPRVRAFGYVAPAVSLLLLVPPLFFVGAVLSILVTRQTVQFTMPLCARCARRWVIGKMAVALTPLVGIGLIAIGIAWRPLVLLVPVGFVMALAGTAILWVVLRGWGVQLQTFEKDTATLRGLHPSVEAALRG
jgi:hypothetical protein